MWSLQFFLSKCVDLMSSYFLGLSFVTFEFKTFQTSNWTTIIYFTYVSTHSKISDTLILWEANYSSQFIHFSNWKDYTMIIYQLWFVRRKFLRSELHHQSKPKTTIEKSKTKQIKSIKLISISICVLWSTLSNI